MLSSGRRRRSSAILSLAILTLWSALPSALSFSIRPLPSVSKEISLFASTADDSFEGTVRVCNGPTCTQKGGKKTLELIQQVAEASEGRLTVETVKCVSECAECGLGPNVELRAKGDSGPFYPIKNNVRSAQDVQTILGVSSVPEPSN